MTSKSTCCMYQLPDTFFNKDLFASALATG